MAGKQIKGLTVEIGGDTSSLGKALDSITKKGKSLSSELGSINKLLKLDPSNTELLAQKQKILADAISNTEEKLSVLREAEKQAQAQFERGEISAEQYRALQREVIAAEAKLKQYKNALQETAQAAADLEKGTDKATHGLQQQEKQTEETKKETLDLDSSLGDAVKGGFAALIAAAGTALAAIAALAESTREYRTEMSKLDTAFKDANFTASTARKTYKELQGIFGETDQAVEAANHLAMLCSTEEELNQWTDILTGTYAKWGASLQPEALAEASNETARTGAVTGALADALNWAAAEGETFGVTMRKATKKNEEWNKAVEDAVTAEDYFNLALQECSSEQERQQLITKTLTGLYKGAATQYKRTNTELIRANKANDEWNSTLAECGEVVEPVVTDVKELGTALLKQAKAPLKDVANYIRNTFLPALVKVGSWAKQNLPQIINLAAEVAATVVLYKGAALSAELATKGLTLATIAQQAAQKALNLITNANPYMLMATAIVGVTAALTALSLAMDDTVEVADTLTDAERSLIEESHAAADAFREQQKATQDTMKGTKAEMDHIQDLADELLTLADASGAVQEKDQARADFIIGQLNEALGKEYSMIGGVIQQYDDLKASVNEVIEATLAQALLEDSKQDYVDAIKSRASAYEALKTAEWALLEQKQASLPEIERINTEIANLETKRQKAIALSNEQEAMRLEQEIQDLEYSLESHETALTEKQHLYDTALMEYENYYNTISAYETAQVEALNENYQLAADILTGQSDAYRKYGETVVRENQKAIDAHNRQVAESLHGNQVALESHKSSLDAAQAHTGGVFDQMRNMITTTFDGVDAEVYSLGVDIGNGLANGMESTRSTLEQKGRSLFVSMYNAARAAADSHSPSRKMIDFGEDVGEGAVIGVDNKTEDVAQAGQRQAQALLDSYRSQEVKAQNTLRGVADRQAALQAGSYMTAGSQNTGVLNKILTAIEKGQVLTINEDLLIGATEGKMDGALGARQILAERGAL